MSDLEIKSVGVNSLIQVTFPDGAENPRFVIENMEFTIIDSYFFNNGEGNKPQASNSQSAVLKACAKLFLDKAEVIEAESKKSINNQVVK